MIILAFLSMWLYYAKFFILGSIVVTHMLNKLTNKLYYPPLIINMFSAILLLLLPRSDVMRAIYLNYLPVVITSIVMNLIIYIYRKIKNKK